MKIFERTTTEASTTLTDEEARKMAFTSHAEEIAHQTLLDTRATCPLTESDCRLRRKVQFSRGPLQPNSLTFWCSTESDLDPCPMPQAPIVANDFAVDALHAVCERKRGYSEEL